MDTITTHQPADAVNDQRLKTLLADLTLDEKVQLLTGRDFWTTWPTEGPASAEPTAVVPLKVTLTNTGNRRGKQVVHVYAERPDSSVTNLPLETTFELADSPRYARMGQPGSTPEK